MRQLQSAFKTPIQHLAFFLALLVSSAGPVYAQVPWPKAKTIKFVVPFGFFMLSLQGLSEIIKRIGALQGKITLPAEDLQYEKPMQ